MVRVIKQRNLLQKISANLSDFKLFALMGIIALGIGLTFYLTTQNQDIRQRASGIDSIEYGFNTHLNTSGTWYEYINLTPDFFNKTVDDLVFHQQQWIRFNIIPGESGSLTTVNGTNTFTLNQTNIGKYLDAAKYAKQKGLKVFLVTATPNFPSGYVTLSEYDAITVKYHSDLANIFKDHVDVWQIFNEVDAVNFRDYTKLNELTPSYLTDLKTHFDLAEDAIKAVNSNIQITANVTGFPVSQATFDKWSTFFNTLSPSLDILSLDVYPQNTSEIALLKNAVIGVGSQYSKPVIIAETGFPTGDGRYSEQDQATLLSQTLDQLRQAYPRAIFYYQYSNTLPSTDTTESSFGIVKSDGSFKTSYDAVMQAMRNPTGLLRIQTNPPVGIAITVTSLTTNEVVLTKQWGIDWEKLPAGNYKISYTNPTSLTVNNQPIVLPDDSFITIYNNQTTTVLVDPAVGTSSISPTPSGVPTPTPIPNTPTPTPQTTGLLRVETSPATAATIKILNTNGQVVMSSTWSIDWKPMAQGTYYIQFSYPKTSGLITPRTIIFKHYSNKVTEIIGNFKTGMATIKYY